MKNIYLLLLTSSFAIGAFAQSQRMVLAEEFTQASCGPCAAANPAFNTLLQANPTKVVAIKYQTNWPGVDPMNVQTQSDVGPRVTYYATNGVPYATMDGSVAAVSSPNYAGSPSNWTTNIINTQYNVPSPFSLSVTHTMSSDFDSAFVTVIVTASQSYTSGGALKLHLGMTEKVITFATPPGSNGETVFYDVMRKMYPSAAGSLLNSTWTNAQTTTMNFVVTVPNYIYDKSQINFVTWIQDDGNKAVQQAAGDSPIVLANDASVIALAGIGSSCSGNYNPTVTLKNNGSVALTSCDIMTQLDMNAAVTYAWTGNLAPGASTVVSIAPFTATAGSHTYNAWPANPNGTPVFNTSYASQTASFSVNIGAGTAIPYTNNFSATVFPYAGWALNNADAGISWVRVGTNSGSVKYDCYSYGSAGEIDEFIIEPIDLTNMSNASINFKVAHAIYNNTYSDALEVLVSTNCGATWVSMWTKAGAVLATAPATTSAFTPSATQWRAECIDLASYSGNNQVFVMFRGINGYGNNIYVDDINISNVVCSVGILETATSNTIDVLPNPFDQFATINLNLVNTQEVAIEIYSLTGELISKINHGELAAGKQVISIDGTELANGMYFITVRTGASIFTSKVSVVH